MERFIGVLIEHCAGKFPLWLSPEQYAILPISDKFVEYAEQIRMQLSAHDIRGFVDDRTETIGKKIRETELKKIPFMLIVGDKEMSEGTVSVRKQGEGDLGSMTVAGFVDYFRQYL
jgi:threonyl-tRNA synthetase